MTLNDLAIRMSVLLEDRYGSPGFYPSSLSRVLHGERQFTAKQWEVFCELLDLTSYERATLESALAKALIMSHGLAFDLTNWSDFEELLQVEREEINSIKVMWLGGLPKRAMVIGELANKRQVSELKRYTSWKHRKALLLIRSELLYYLGRVYASSLLPEEAFMRLHGLAHAQAEMANEFMQPEINRNLLLARAYNSQADAFYVMGKWDEARRLYSRCLEIERDPSIRFELIHGISLSAAYCRDGSEYFARVNQMRDSLEKQSFGPQVESLLFEADGRGRALLQRRETWNGLEQSLQIISRAQAQGEPMVLRRVQYKRDKVIALMFVKRGDAKTDELMKEVGDALTLAREHSYLKYLNELELLIREHIVHYSHFYPLLELFTNPDVFVPS